MRADAAPAVIDRWGQAQAQEARGRNAAGLVLGENGLGRALQIWPCAVVCVVGCARAFSEPESAGCTGGDRGRKATRLADGDQGLAALGCRVSARRYREQVGASAGVRGDRNARIELGFSHGARPCEGKNSEIEVAIPVAI